jgi:glycosyltransferase involved in cell wall biosynthesis
MISMEQQKCAKSAVLRKEVHESLEEIKKADILVGIPSYNNATTIGHVARAVQAGLAKYFPDMRSVLVNSDGGSTDDTVCAFQDAVVEDFKSLFIPHRVSPMRKINTPYHGIPGKGSAFRTIFEIARNLDVKACVVVDSDLRSITPEWIDLLLSPVLKEGFDFVAPYYLRHRFDGTITNSIVYPVTRALYGKRIRQPIGGDFGFTGELAKLYLEDESVWESDIARFGVDIWMTTTAVANNFKVCQSFLGAKIHAPKEPHADLSNMLREVMGVLFDLMDKYEDKWTEVSGSEPTEMYGFRYDAGLEPIHVDIERMIDKFILGREELGSIWQAALPAELIWYLHSLEPQPWQNFRLPAEMWADIIYNFAIAYHRTHINKTHLLKSLTPLYLARVASFINEAMHSNAEEVENILEDACLKFEEKKAFLIEKWD